MGALRNLMERTGRSYLRLSIKFNDEPDQKIELELFDEVLPQSADAFLAKFEQGATRSRVVRVKKDSFIHFAPLTPSPPVPVIAESYHFTHSRPGLIGFCTDSSGKIDASQWYVTLQDMHRLDGKFVVFGRVIHGMRAFWRLAKEETTWCGTVKAHVVVFGAAQYEEQPSPQVSPREAEEPPIQDGGEIAADAGEEEPATEKSQTEAPIEATTDTADELPLADAEELPSLEGDDMRVAATKLQCTFRGRRSRKTTQQQRKLVEAVAESNVIEATVAEEAPETQATQEGGVETQQSPPVDDAVNENSAAEKPPPAIIEASADDLDAPVDDDVPLVPPLKPAAIIESTADDLGAPMTDDDFPRADPEDERAAATKLQSTYRGSKVRKEMKNR